MWTNSLLKQNAWKTLKPYYWTAFGVTVMYIIAASLPNLLSRGLVSASIHVSNGDVQRWVSLLEEMTDMSEMEIEDHLPELLSALAPIYRWLAMLAVSSWAVTIVGMVFVVNLIECGVCDFYCKARTGEVDLGRFFRYFMGGRYTPVMKVMFFRWLYTFLWTLLFYIPGIVKKYEYYLIPYLLAENPNLSKERAFAISKMTMDGEKWKCFVLEFSFIGWYILGWLCCYVGVIAVIPYQQATMAEFYTCMRAKMLAMGIATESELNPDGASDMYSNMGNMAM